MKNSKAYGISVLNVIEMAVVAGGENNPVQDIIKQVCSNQCHDECSGAGENRECHQVCNYVCH